MLENNLKLLIATPSRSVDKILFLISETTSA